MNDADRDNLLEAAKSAYHLELAADKTYTALARLELLLHEWRDLQKHLGAEARAQLASLKTYMAIIIILLGYIAYKIS